ncbi:MAG: hypothetical protein ACI4GY_03925 [Acutalibacteraceae bacterium]
MINSNLLTVHFEKRETALKWLCASAAYSLLFSFLANPAEKTISLIAKEHLWLFFFFTVLYSIAMLINFSYMRKTFDVKNPLLKWLGIIINAIFPLTLTTLMPEKAVGGELSAFATAVHWICGFGNILINATVVLVSLLLISKKQSSNKKIKAVFAAGTIICILDLLVFLILTVVFRDPQKSKNGLFEIIPLAVTFATLYIINHTDLISSRRERDNKEFSLKASDNSAFSALCFGVLCASWATFTFYAFVRNPVHYTISMTGIEYKGGFTLVCLLLTAAFLLNFIHMFKRHHYKNYFTIAVALIGSISLIACVITPTTMEKDISPMHSVGALMFFYFLLAAFSFFLISKSKENKKYRPFLIGMLAVFAGTIIVVVILFVILDQNAGRTGLTELIPLEYMFVFTFLENYTNYFEKAEIKQSALV